MLPGLRITNVRFTSASEADLLSGLLGFATCVINKFLVLDGIAVRQTQDGHLALSFPAQRDKNGHQRFPVRPIDDRARRAFERQVLGALDLDSSR